MPLPVKAGDIFTKARFFLNDNDGAVYTDSVLLPALQVAYEDLRLETEDNNLPITNATSDVITITAGVTNIGGAGGPALPLGLVEIIEMYERTAGSGNDFIQMRRRNFLPKTDFITTYLEVYTWQDQIIKLLGATGDVEVKIDYVGSTLGDITDANSQIRLFNCCSFLWYRTAALAANYIGENKTRSDELNGEALRAIEVLESIGIKNQQSNPVRRRPFMSAYRQRGWASGIGAR